MWNARRTKPPFWPAHRVVNQTADSFGLRLIILRDETSDPLQGLALLPAEFGSAIAFLVRRTLTPVPMPGMPTQLVQALRGFIRSLYDDGFPQYLATEAVLAVCDRFRFHAAADVAKCVDPNAN